MLTTIPPIVSFRENGHFVCLTTLTNEVFRPFLSYGDTYIRRTSGSYGHTLHSVLEAYLIILAIIVWPLGGSDWTQVKKGSYS